MFLLICSLFYKTSQLLRKQHKNVYIKYTPRYTKLCHNQEGTSYSHSYHKFSPYLFRIKEYIKYFI